MLIFFCVDVMYSGEYDACDIVLISKELDSVPKYHILEPT
jgi:hypothetical protein